MRTARIAPLLACLVLCNAPSFADERPRVLYEPLVLTGQPSPGGGTFGSFPYHSYINDQSYTVFMGSPVPGGHSPDGIYLAHRQRRGDITLSKVAKLGQHATGEPDGVHFLSFDINYHRVNAAGQATFEAWLAGPGVMGTGDENTNAGSNWFYSDGQLTKIAQYGAPAAGIPGATYRWVSRTSINDLGHVAFVGDLAGVGHDTGSAFWYGDPGNLQVLARAGQPLPGKPSLRYGPLGLNYPVLSSGGHVAFGALVEGLGNVGFGNTAILVGTPGNFQVAALSGDPAPGTNTTFLATSGHTDLKVNNNGEVTFAYILNDGSRALYAGKPGDLRLLARTGEPAPGLPGQTFDFFHGSMLNDRGDAAFVADVQVTDDQALAVYLAEANKSPRLIAARGQQAPGAADDTHFGWFISEPIINKDGQVAFFASLEGEGSRGEHDYGIFATGHSGDLRLIARVGDQFEIADGDVRTIAALSHAGIFGSHILSFNADSDLSFLIRFTDGSEGLFTATVLPEPSALVWLALALPLLSRHRRYPQS